jgi:hypothetical protein
VQARQLGRVVVRGGVISVIGVGGVGAARVLRQLRVAQRDGALPQARRLVQQRDAEEDARQHAQQELHVERE